MPGLLDETAALAAKIFFSSITLLKGAIVPAFIVFALVLVGGRLRQVIEKETKWKWVLSTLATTFVVSWCIALLAYFYPIITASQEHGLGLLPSSIAPSLGDLVASYLYGVLKVTLVAAVVALLLIPLEFVGVYIHSVVDRRLAKLPAWVKLLATSYLTTLIASFIILFIVPEAVTGILFLLYYGFPA